MLKYVSYLRVSTVRQGVSGLGLEAQREIIKKHLNGNEPLAEYVEVESGRKKVRPKLKEALARCKKENAILIVANLDRLARNVSFLSNLLESEIEIVFCDFPQANKMVLHILSAISQYEAELIASRTKQALAAKKSRGYKLGNPEHLLEKHEQAIKNSVATNKAKAMNNPNNKRAIALLKILMKENKSYRQMAEALNSQGFVTAKGGQFRASTVYLLVKRINSEKGGVE
mgnify:CR=1 FL=1